MNNFFATFRTENPLSSGWEGWYKHRQNLEQFLDLKEISPELMFYMNVFSIGLSRICHKGKA